MSLYILYMLISLSITSLPFYFYRASEVLFELPSTFANHRLFNSRTFAQLLIFGASCKPILYFILFAPSKIVFKFKCYTSIRIEASSRVDGTDDEDDALFLSGSLEQQDMYYLAREHHDRYSLRLSSLYPLLHMQLRTMTKPGRAMSNQPSSKGSMNMQCHTARSSSSQV